MKYSFLILLMIPFNSFGSSWKSIAETKNCDEKIKILAKEGEKYVVALKGDEKIKLFSKDGSTFKVHTMSSSEFSNLSSNEFSNQLQGTQYRFIRPGEVEGNPPKLDILVDEKKKRCRMEHLQ